MTHGTGDYKEGSSSSHASSLQASRQVRSHAPFGTDCVPLHLALALTPRVAVRTNHNQGITDILEVMQKKSDAIGYPHHQAWFRRHDSADL